VTLTPDAGLNGNWVVYGIPDASGTGASPPAPSKCVQRADGTSFDFGDEVDISCCTNIEGSTA